MVKWLIQHRSTENVALQNRIAYMDFTTWLPKREKTLMQMLKFADAIARTTKDTDTADIFGDGIDIIGTGLEYIPGVDVASIPLELAGTAIAGASQVAKSIKIPKEVKEAQECIDSEINNYGKLVSSLKKLHDVIDKEITTSPSFAKTAAAIDGFQEAFDFLKRYVKLGERIAKDVSQAASKAASTAATRAARYGLDDSEWVINSAKKAAEKAATETVEEAVVKGFSPETTKAIAEAAGEAAGKAAIDAAERSAAKSTAYAFRQPIIEAVEKAALSASRDAAKPIAHEAVKMGLSEVGRVVDKATGGMASVFAKPLAEVIGKSVAEGAAKVVGHLVPVLNVGFVAWDIYDIVDVSKELYYGSDAEHQVRDKIDQLTQERDDILKYLCTLKKLPVVEYEHWVPV